MKKIFFVLLIIACLLLCSCALKTNDSNFVQGVSADETAPIQLTIDNINNYIKFDGEFVDGKYTMGIVNWAEATLEFQAYPCVSGNFANVEISLVCTSDDHTFTYMNHFGNFWHLSNDDDEKEIKITFTLDIDGRFSKNYSVECNNNTGKLSGTCNFEVKSVHGTYTPN